MNPELEKIHHRINDLESHLSQLENSQREARAEIRKLGNVPPPVGEQMDYKWLTEQFNGTRNWLLGVFGAGFLLLLSAFASGFLYLSNTDKGLSEGIASLDKNLSVVTAKVDGLTNSFDSLRADLRVLVRESREPAVSAPPPAQGTPSPPPE